MKKINVSYIGLGFFLGAVIGAIVEWITKDSSWFVIIMMFGLALGAAYDSRINKAEDKTEDK